MTTLPPTHDFLSALDELVSRLEASHVPVVNVAPNAWEYAREPIASIKAMLEEVGTPGTRNIIDVGSGVGTKLALLNLLGWATVEGIEIVPEYVAESRRLYPEFTVHQADAWDHDYSGYDVVYCYGIERDPERQAEFDARVSAQLRPGAVLLTPGR